ncbi:MAG TPA: hypothetical protein VL068_14080 [Microthrixaceae bacterium]|nr:hypothetical protein [Microthrixaceae bacterium]
MKDRPERRHHRRKTGGALLTVTAVFAALLVAVTTGVSSAAPVSSEVPAICSGADKESLATLGLAKALIGSDTIAVKLMAKSKGDIPANAGIDEDINAAFDWSGTLDQNLIDQAAGLKLALKITNIKSQMLVKGPSSVDAFSANGPNASVTPVAGKPAVLSLGSIGGPIKTTGGGIITYRVGAVTLTTSLSLSGQNFVINLKCSTVGTNLIAKTTVKDPDAPTFTPDVVKLKANAGESVSVDLLNGVITPGKTPLIDGSLKIVENPAGGTSSIQNGVFTFTAPSTPGTYSTTVEICGEPKADSGIAGVNEVQKLQLGDNWSPNNFIAPRPIAFTLKFGDQETGLIWATNRLPNQPLPTPTNWFPENKAGVVNSYLLNTYVRPSASVVQAALEALPNIGAGNIKLTDLREKASNPGKVTGYNIDFQGELAEQDVAEITLGQWYSVPPQEMLDRIGQAVANIAGEMGGDPVPGAFDFKAAAGITDTDSAVQRSTKADAYMTKRIQESISGGPAVKQDEWDGWIGVRLIDPIMDAVPAIIAWLNSLFPEKILVSTTTAGESPTPPQDLCAQGIIDVTVAAPEVAANNGNNPDVLAVAEVRKISIAG